MQGSSDHVTFHGAVLKLIVWPACGYASFDTLALCVLTTQILTRSCFNAHVRKCPLTGKYISPINRYLSNKIINIVHFVGQWFLSCGWSVWESVRLCLPVSRSHVCSSRGQGSCVCVCLGMFLIHTCIVQCQLSECIHTLKHKTPNTPQATVNHKLKKGWIFSSLCLSISWFPIASLDNDRRLWQCVPCSASNLRLRSMPNKWLLCQMCGSEWRVQITP